VERILIVREHLFWKNRKSVHDEFRRGVHDVPEYARRSECSKPCLIDFSKYAGAQIIGKLQFDYYTWFYCENSSSFSSELVEARKSVE
jgi:hypothetical protein